MLNWIENRLLDKGLKYRAHSFYQSTNEDEKILSRKISVTTFLKRPSVVLGKQTERVFMQKQPSKGFFKKGATRNFA